MRQLPEFWRIPAPLVCAPKPCMELDTTNLKKWQAHDIAKNPIEVTVGAITMNDLLDREGVSP